VQDNDALMRRLKRYFTVSSKLGGVAAQLFGEKYMGFALDQETHAEDIKKILGSLKGPIMKIAQLLATIPDALPTAYAAELSQLQANAPSMGWPFVSRRMQTELGSNWQERFQSFDKVATAAASLGQVHKALSLKGESLACKLQYLNSGSYTVPSTHTQI